MDDVLDASTPSFRLKQHPNLEDAGISILVHIFSRLLTLSKRKRPLPPRGFLHGHQPANPRFGPHTVFPVGPQNNQADVDGSGRVDAVELAAVLREAGFTPVTGSADGWTSRGGWTHLGVFPPQKIGGKPPKNGWWKNNGTPYVFLRWMIFLGIPLFFGNTHLI